MRTALMDPSRCPLCGRGNSCAMAAGQADASSCWCRDFPLDPAAGQRALSKPGCICAACGRDDRLVSEEKTGA